MLFAVVAFVSIHAQSALAQSSEWKDENSPATVKDVEDAARRYSNDGTTVVNKITIHYQATTASHTPTDVSFDSSGKSCDIKVFDAYVCSAPKKRCAYFEKVRKNSMDQGHKVTVSYDHGYCSIKDEP